MDFSLQQNVSYSITDTTISSTAPLQRHGQSNLELSTIYDPNGYVAVEEPPGSRPVRPHTNQTTSSLHCQNQLSHEGTHDHLQCQQNPSYVVSATSPSNDHQDPDCRDNPSYNVVPGANVIRRHRGANEPNGNTDSDVTYDYTVAEPNAALAGDSNQDGEFYESLDHGHLAEPPPPSYEYVVSSNSPHNVSGLRPSPRLPQDTQAGQLNQINGQQLPNVTIVSTHKPYTGGEHYRLSIVMLILTIILCQFHVLLCAIPAIVFSVKSIKSKENGDLERAMRYDKYSLRFIIPGMVFIIMTAILLAISPVLGGLAFIVWLIIFCTSLCP